MKYACVVFLGSSLSLFAQSVDYKPAASSPLKFPKGVHSFAVGDANADGKPDLLVSQGTNLTVLLGNGSGGFEPLTNTSITLPHPATEVLLADVNRDGHLDWAGAFHETYDVIVMLGKGNGQFSPVPESPFVTRAPGKRPHTHALAAGDVNRDGKLDLITANSEDGDISVLLGDGRGGFTPAHGSPFACGPSPYPVALADVNGDNNLDIVVPNTAPGPTTITVLLGDGRGEFHAAPRSPFKANDRAYFVAVADLNGDNKPDIVATHDDASIATIHLGDGNGNFVQASNSPLELGNRGWSVVPVDANRDGKIDLAFGAEHGVAVFLGDGRGGFQRASGSPFRTGRGTWRIEVIDVNQDGKPDFITNNVESNDISILLAQ
ncbi:MAG TPA: VCBS repeat-containing protein [Candidatus Binatia bacterium]|nr:VCBS repeat-containing protein [Candidatus Binatia bacterium]